MRTSSQQRPQRSFAQRVLIRLRDRSGSILGSKVRLANESCFLLQQ